MNPKTIGGSAMDAHPTTDIQPRSRRRLWRWSFWLGVASIATIVTPLCIPLGLSSVTIGWRSRIHDEPGRGYAITGILLGLLALAGAAFYLFVPGAQD